MIGRVLDEKYRIIRSIGAGGMGGVYEAERVDTGVTVAVKVIHGSLADDADDTLVPRFEREARAAGAIDSPHIARVIDAGIDPDSYRPFMVMEYLEGEDAQQLFGRLGLVSPDLALRIAAQACIGLREAHAARIVHRDIKPANLFLARGEGSARIVKLVDFGVAKVSRQNSDSQPTEGLTQTGTMLGSPLYMAPEQARSAKLVDHRSDIWSLGMVLYRALAGRTPYQHVRGLGDLVLALCSDLPPLVQYFAPWVSPQITAIVDRALRIDPNERFQSADEMLDAIRPLLPDGFAIDASMIQPLSDAAREKTAQVFVRHAVGGPSGAVAINARPSPVLFPPPAAPDPASTRTPVPLSALAAALQGNDTAAPPTALTQRAPSVQTAVIVLLSVALGGVGVYAFTRMASEASGTSSPSQAKGAVSADPRVASSPVTSASFVGPGPRAPSSKSPPTQPSTERTRPADPAKEKSPLRLDHTSFGDRK